MPKPYSFKQERVRDWCWEPQWREGPQARGGDPPGLSLTVLTVYDLEPSSSPLVYAEEEEREAQRISPLSTCYTTADEI